MLKKLIISFMTIGLLLGCAQNENDQPPADDQPVDEEIQDDMNDIEDETEDMFEEDVPENNINQDEKDQGMDDAEDPAAPEEDKDKDER